MNYDFRGLNKSGEFQEFHLVSRGARDYWWPRGQKRLRVAWLPPDKIRRPQRGMALHQWDSKQRIWLKEDEHSLFLWRRGVSLAVNFKEGWAEARISKKNDWQIILRILYFFGFLKEQGLLLHASSLVHRGMAYVFPGASGAGKTTIVRLSPELPLLTDEISAIQLTGNGQVLGHGTPFFGDLGQPGQKLTVPVKGLYFPVKAAENQVAPLDPSETARRLMSCVCVFTTEPERLKAIFALSHRLAERLPGYLLYFRPEPEFWRAIDGS
jgi:hypothetical protein